jgi:hypothetical protein
VKLFKAILRSHVEVDDHLDDRGSTARSPHGKLHWAQLRVLNDHAYFLMLFAQLENHITVQCAKLVAAKKSTRSWRSRRLWDTTDLDNLSFMRKVALLTEKGHGIYNKMYDYYQIRCEIAHGNSAGVGPILLPTLATDLLAVARHLRA